MNDMDWSCQTDWSYSFLVANAYMFGNLPPEAGVLIPNGPPKCAYCGKPLDDSTTKFLHPDGRVVCFFVKLGGDCRRPAIEALLSEGYRFYEEPGG